MQFISKIFLRSKKNFLSRPFQMNWKLQKIIEVEINVLQKKMFDLNLIALLLGFNHSLLVDEASVGLAI